MRAWALVVAAIEVHRPTLEQCLENVQVLTQVTQRRVEVYAKVIPHPGPMAGAHPQPKATWSKLGNHLGLLDHNYGVAREDGRDGGSKQDTLGVYRSAWRRG